VSDAGRNLAVYQPPGSSFEDTLYYLTGPVFGFALRLLGWTALHGSTVARGGRAICFVGGSGAGKSTLACALCQEGFRLVAEDISALDTTDSVRVAPGRPRIHLWPDAATALLGERHGLNPLTPSWDKLYFDAKPRAGPALLDCVYVLGAREAGAGVPRIEPMPPRERLMALLANAYMNYLPENRWRARDLDVLSRVAEDVQVRRLVTRADLSGIRETCRLIERDGTEPRDRSG